MRAQPRASSLPSRSTHYLIGAGEYGVSQLANLALLPSTGAVFIVAPLKLTGRTGNRVRALALVPRG